MTKLLLIRHGATAGNMQRRYIGNTDEPLCETGIRQICSMRQQNLKVSRLFISPMQRTMQTAQILFPQMEYLVVQELQEMNFGIFEGKSANELADHPDYQAWVASYCMGSIPDGECVAEFKARCCTAFCKIMSTAHDDEIVALIVHGGVIMAILEAFARPRRGFYDHPIHNGDCVQCTYKAGVIMVCKQIHPNVSVSCGCIYNSGYGLR